MSNMVTKIKCSRCLGTGVDNNVIPNVSCTICAGTGYIDSEVSDITEIMDELNWIKRKIKKILKAMDIPED